MKEISLHILDIVENSLRAKAKKVRISILEDTRENNLELIIEDDGEGMDEETLKRVRDPFFSGQSKKVGMGIPLLDQLAKQCQGNLEILSEKGKGTTLRATFQRDNLDLPPLGKLADTLCVIMASHPEVELEFVHRIDDCEWLFNSKKMEKELELTGESQGMILPAIREWIEYQEEILKGGIEDENK